MSFLKKPDKMFCDPAIHDKVASTLGFMTEEKSESMRGMFSSFFTLTTRLMRQEAEPLVVGIILSHVDNYWEVAAVRSMIDSLQRAYSDTHHFDFVVFSAENTSDKLNAIIGSQLLEAVGYRYDVCVGFAPWVVAQLRDTFIQTGCQLPIIFGGVATPERLGFAGDLSRSNEGITGVAMAVPAYYNQVKTIRDLKPELTDLLIPYDTTLTHAGLPEHCYGATESFASSWKDLGGKVKVVEVEAHHDIAEKLLEAASPRSMINLSTTSSIIAQTDKIIRACNTYNIPVFAHNRQAVRRGTVLGSGGSADPYGPPLAQLIGKICIERKPFSEVPLSIIYEHKDVCFFDRALRSQGFMHLDDAQLRAMRMLPIHEIVE